MQKRGIPIISIFLVVLTSTLVSAMFYSYNEKIPITDGNKEIGYVKPYQKNIFGTNYAYVKWQRYSFPVGDSFPIALIKGTTTAATSQINFN